MGLRPGNDLIQRWREFVEQVEKGYTFGLDDYCNDLDLRAAIEEAGLAGEVEDADRRFRALLAHTERAVWSSDVPGAFWVRGYPVNASGELLADLKARAQPC